MKKYLISASILASVLFLAGCTITPAANTSQKPKEYELSKSIWKSTDGGKTWVAKNITLKSPTVSDLDILRIAVNPQDSNNIFVGLKKGGMIRSTDGGDHWEFTNFISEKVYGLEIDPTDGKTLYVSGIWQKRGKIFKSEDGGGNWKEIYTAAADDGPLIVSMAIDRNNRQIIYAGTSENQVIKSTDGGISWKNIYQSKSPVVQIAIDKTDSNLLFLLTLSGNIFRSRNGGTDFQDLSSKTSSNHFSFNGGFRVLKTDPSASNVAYLAGNSGIIRSKDGGESWEKVIALDNPESFPVTALGISPQNSQRVIYGASQASYKSEDGGNNWMTFQFDVAKYIDEITFDPNNSNVVFAGFKK